MSRVLKIVCMSDTHSLHRRFEVPDGDVFIHAGDITREGEIDTLYDFSIWLAGLPHKWKVVIGGNHDFCLDISHPKYDPRARRMLEDRRPNIRYLEDSACEIEGLKFFGTPWVPNLANWAFYDRGRNRFEHAPTDIDVLVSHGPPYDRRDREAKLGLHVGSIHLQRYVERCPRLRLHVCGHVHEGYGMTPPAGSADARTLITVNAASLDRQYQPVNAPIVMEMAVPVLPARE